MRQVSLAELIQIITEFTKNDVVAPSQSKVKFIMNGKAYRTYTSEQFLLKLQKLKIDRYDTCEIWVSGIPISYQATSCGKNRTLTITLNSVKNNHEN